MRGLMHRSAAQPSVPTLGIAGIRDLEVTFLGRYLAVGFLVSLCGLLWAWSRIDLRETAVGLDAYDRQLQTAYAEGQRLELERAALLDSARLDVVADELGLVVPEQVEVSP